MAFRPAPGLLRRGVDVFGLVDELASLGALWTVVDTCSLPAFDALEVDTAYLAWRWLLLTAHDEARVREVFLFVAADSQVSITPVADSAAVGSGPDPALLRAWSGGAPVTPPLHATNRHAADGGGAAGASQAGLDDDAVDRAAARRPGDPGNPRPAARRVEEQLALVGELVIAQAALQQACEGLRDSRVRAAVEQVARLTARIQDNAISLGKVPVAGLLESLRRHVDALAAAGGGDGRLSVQGETAELDATIVDALRGPLHALADHLLGRGPAAASRNLALAVRSQGTEVCFEFRQGSGDGREGEQGGAALPQAIQRALAPLRGTVTQQTLPDGARVAEIRLPSALGVVDGLLVEVGGQRLVLPLAPVEEILDLAGARSGAGSDAGSDLLNVRGRALPCVRLREIFGDPDSDHAARHDQVVVVDDGRQNLGLVVDRVLGQCQAVIKPLSPLAGGHTLFAGTTILGDGRVALIADLAGVLRRARAEAYA